MTWLDCEARSPDLFHCQCLGPLGHPGPHRIVYLGLKPETRLWDTTGWVGEMKDPPSRIWPGRVLPLPPEDEL